MKDVPQSNSVYIIHQIKKKLKKNICVFIWHVGHHTYNSIWLKKMFKLNGCYFNICIRSYKFY